MAEVIVVVVTVVFFIAAAGLVRGCERLIGPPDGGERDLPAGRSPLSTGTDAPVSATVTP